MAVAGTPQRLLPSWLRALLMRWLLPKPGGGTCWQLHPPLWRRGAVDSEIMIGATTMRAAPMQQLTEMATLLCTVRQQPEVQLLGATIHQPTAPVRVLVRRRLEHTCHESSELLLQHLLQAAVGVVELCPFLLERRPAAASPAERSACTPMFPMTQLYPLPLQPPAQPAALLSARRTPVALPPPPTLPPSHRRCRWLGAAASPSAGLLLGCCPPVRRLRGGRGCDGSYLD